MGSRPATIVFAVLLFVAAPSYSTKSTSNSETERYVSDPNSVGFDIASVPRNSGAAWAATYTSGGKVARFQIELGPSRPFDQEAGIEMRSGAGRFIADPRSEGNVLLADLAKALEAKTVPKHVRRVDAVSFDYVTLGERQSQAQDGRGGFSDKPPGNWTPMKVFVGKQGDCSFFLNLNPVIKKGQISIKDEDYGNCAIAQLAKVL